MATFSEVTIVKETTVLNLKYIKFQEEVFALFEKRNETLSSQIIVEMKKTNEREYLLLLHDPLRLYRTRKRIWGRRGYER